MINNRAMPSAEIIPVLAYDNVGEAATWLCRTFGFAERLRIGTHRIQLVFGASALVVAQRSDGAAIPAAKPDRGIATHSVLARVDDVDAHYARTIAAGAETGGAPVDYAFGERQYSAVDIGGHQWTFSQSIKDVDPAAFGGQLL